MRCRFCYTELNHVFIDLVNSPPSNSYLNIEQLNEPEIFYPLKVFICEKCFLVQVDEYKKSSEIFSKEYMYFSSFSSSWLEHCKKYTDMMIERFGISEKSKVVEIASNDGYLLQYFKNKNIPVLGIEPSSSTAKIAIEKGIETIEEFFTVSLADYLVSSNIRADLIVGNNVLAHVPQINDFVAALKILLKDNGIITMEFPHLLNLVEQIQFDTIYHEHYSYVSFIAVNQIFNMHGLVIFDVDELDTHGGSLRIYAKHFEDKTKSISSNVQQLVDKEILKGMNKIDYYISFQEKANEVKYNLLNFLIQQKKNNKKVAAYGAAAKGNTLLNYCGIKKDLISFVVDKSPYKQNKFLPGSHIPVKNEKSIKEEKPEYIIILPWNLKDEIMKQLEYVRDWDAKFVIPLPDLVIF